MKRMLFLLFCLFFTPGCVQLMAAAMAVSMGSVENEIIEKAKLARPDYEDRDKTGWLGFDYVIRKNWGRTEVWVTKVYENSPASRAGLEVGDVIISVETYGVPEFEIITDPDTGEKIVGPLLALQKPRSRSGLKRMEIKIKM